MNASKLLVLVVVVGGLYWWWSGSSPKSDSIIKDMVVADGTISYGGVSYQVEWARRAKKYAGDIRDIQEVYNRHAPFNTHQVLITTGDFSDPNKVQIDNGQVKVTLAEALEGEFTIVHLVPQGVRGLERLRQLEIGQKVKIIGKEEADGQVKGSDGGYINFGTNGQGRPLVLVESISTY